jgi:transposase-like protein/IS1 family transposase
MRKSKKRPCFNPNCPDVGSSAHVIKAGKDKRGRQRYLCKTCCRSFSPTKGTLFYRLRKPKKDFLEALALLAERNSIAAVARVKQVKEETVAGWLAKAGRHAQEVEEHLLRDFYVARLQLDELWAYVRNRGGKGGTPRRPRRGSCWKAMAFDPKSKLRVARAVGKRDQTLLERLLRQVQERVVGREALASDQLPGYEEAIVEIFGKVPSYRGRGRPPTKKRPPVKLRYGQVVKEREKGRVVAVRECIVFGDQPRKSAALGGRVSTSGVERTQLTSRQSNGRLVRKTLSYSKKREMLEWACAWEDLVYNFVKPVKTLRGQVQGGRRCWVKRTPAMAAGLTDHVWSVRDLAESVAPSRDQLHQMG